MRTSRGVAATLFVTLCAVAGLGADPPLAQVEVFRAGENGYHTYRIPALITTTKGTLLAFCEGRRASRSDTGDIDVVLKRSFDNGKTWSNLRVVADFGEDTVGNPAPVIERRTRTVFLLLTSNPGKVTEKQIVDSTAESSRTVWLMSSTNDGATWSKPREITPSVKRPDWTWYATGPGNGIQLQSGRLAIPCDHIRRGTKAMHSHLIYSDDRGRTCSVSGRVENDGRVALALLVTAQTRRGARRSYFSFSL